MKNKFKSNLFLLLFMILFLYIFSSCNKEGDIVSGAIGTAAEVISQNSQVQVQNEDITVVDDTMTISSSSLEEIDRSIEEYRKKLEHEPVYYTSTKDPFKSPLDDIEKSGLLNPMESVLEGVISGPRGLLAIIRSNDGKHWLLRRGDKVNGGDVAEITPEAVTFVLSQYGTITKIVAKNERSNEEEL